MEHKQDDDRWTIDTIKILKKYVSIWEDPEKGKKYVFTFEVAKMQNEIADKLNNNLKSITVIRVENDTDHDSQTGYFDCLRSLIRKHRHDKLLIISTLEKRKRYLSTHTDFNYICTYNEIIQQNSFIDSNIKTIIVDRCHVLGLREFHKMLLKFQNSDSKFQLYLCGSTLCLPETIGQPFQDIYNDFCCLHHRVIPDRIIKSEDIQTDKIGKKFDNIQSMLSERKSLGSMYIIVNSKNEKQNLIQMKIDKEIGIDAIKTIDELKYQDPSRTTIVIFIKQDGGDVMNKNKLAKCLSCASTKLKSAAIIGDDDDIERIKQKYIYPRQSVLTKIIESKTLNL